MRRMRRIIWVLVFAVSSMALGGCWNYADPFHPKVCPKYQKCEPSCCNW